MECKQFFEQKSRCFQTRLQSDFRPVFSPILAQHPQFAGNHSRLKVISWVLGMSCLGLEIKLRAILKDTEMINQTGLGWLFRRLLKLKFHVLEVRISMSEGRSKIIQAIKFWRDVPRSYVIRRSQLLDRYLVNLLVPVWIVPVYRL